MNEKSILERLYDDNDNSSIILYDEDGNEVSFDQVAVIPYDGELYAILKPTTKMEGVSEDEAFVFEFRELDNGNIDIAPCENDDISELVFQEYYKLLDSKK